MKEKIKQAIKDELIRQKDQIPDGLGYFDPAPYKNFNDWIIDGQVDPDALAGAVEKALSSD